MKSKFLYVLFNKPYGVLTQFRDPEGRPTLKNYIPFEEIYPVGRLDQDSEGLLFLTNDGPLNHRISDPAFKQPKTYWAQVEGIPTAEQILRLQEEILIGDYKTRAAAVKALENEPALWERSTPIRFRKTVPTNWLEITIHEGKNHQVRKMTAAVGLPCLRLVRMQIGALKLGSLKPGEYRLIPRPELSGLNMESSREKHFNVLRQNDKFSRQTSKYTARSARPRQKKKY
jgi:23S rRNA pseudouridine2457 synthase